MSLIVQNIPAKRSNSNNNSNTRNTSNKQRHHPNNDKDHSNNSNTGPNKHLSSPTLSSNSENDNDNKSNDHPTNNVRNETALRTLKRKINECVEHNHIQRFLNIKVAFGKTKWSPSEPPKGYTEVTYDYFTDAPLFKIIRSGVIVEQTYLLSRRNDSVYLQLCYDKCVRYMEREHSANWSNRWEQGLDEEPVNQFKQIMTVILTRIIIMDTVKTNKLFGDKENTLLALIKTDVGRILRLLKNNKKNAQPTIRYEIYIARMAYKAWQRGAGAGRGKQLKGDIYMSDDESSIAR